MVTIRLADSLPREVLIRLREHRDGSQESAVKQQRIEALLDAGYGECLLRDRRAAEIVKETLLHFAGRRYELHAWVIMPNHVHCLLTINRDCFLNECIKSWKSFSARAINALFAKGGSLWHRDYFDRYIRDAAHFENARCYIEENPVKAGLCDQVQQWHFSSAAGAEQEAVGSIRTMLP